MHKYAGDSYDGRRILMHLNSCKDICELRLSAINRDEFEESHEKGEKRGVWSRIGSFFHHLLGGSDEPFHG